MLKTIKKKKETNEKKKKRKNQISFTTITDQDENPEHWHGTPPFLYLDHQQ